MERFAGGAASVVALRFAGAVGGATIGSVGGTRGTFCVGPDATLGGGPPNVPVVDVRCATLLRMNCVSSDWCAARTSWFGVRQVAFSLPTNLSRSPIGIGFSPWPSVCER